VTCFLFDFPTMPSVCPGVEYDTIAREWRCKWSADDDKKSLAELQKTLEEVMPKVAAVKGLRDTRRIVCGSCNDFKVVMSLPADKFSAWEETKFEPEAEFLDAIKKIKGVTAVETQTYTTMPVRYKPPPKLKKARSFNIAKLNPDSKGFTLQGSIVGEPTEVDPKGASKLYEVTVGDDTAKVICSLKEDQKDALKGAKAAVLRNARVIMVKGHIRVAVDKWGKVEASDEAVEKVGEKNVSETEFELVKG